MSGIYVHIPFCRKACHYCDFHFSTSLKAKGDVLRAINLELKNRSEEINGQIETIYFGGGTPSLLSQSEIGAILDSIATNYNVHPAAEITLEANPEDIEKEAIQGWRSCGINRLSIGVQSFDDEILTFMNRNHDSESAIRSISLSQDMGFSNISIDLIYGVHTRNLDDWNKELERALDFGIPHLSAYNLTIEPQTVFGIRSSKGEVLTSSEEHASKEFLSILEKAPDYGLELYEVSNFSKKGMRSNHNTNYWNNKPYIGVGPGAHSYNLNERSWNVSNNAIYAKNILQDSRKFETELLTRQDQYNEAIMTGLRRVEGLNLSAIYSDYGIDLKKVFKASIEAYLRSGSVLIQDQRLTLTKKGLLLADRIASELFQTND